MTTDGASAPHTSDRRLVDPSWLASPSPKRPPRRAPRSRRHPRDRDPRSSAAGSGVVTDKGGIETDIIVDAADVRRRLGRLAG